MKRIITLILMLFLSLSCTVGGTLLFTGCNTTQEQPENGGGGALDPSEDEDSGNGDKDDDIETNGRTTQQFTLRNYTFTSATGYSGDTDTGARGGQSHVYWLASDEGSQNLSDFYKKNFEGDFSNVHQGYFNGAQSKPDGGKGYSYIARVSYVTYYQTWTWLFDTNKQNRYVEVNVFANDGYKFFGVCAQGNESSMRTVKDDFDNYYFFGNNSTTYAGDYNYLSNNRTYLDQNFNLLGSVVFRRECNVKFINLDSVYSSSTQYAGIGFNLAGIPPAREGYTFGGWLEATNSSNPIWGPNFKFEDSWVDNEEKIFIAQWVANSYAVAFNGNGGTKQSTSGSFNTNLFNAQTFKAFFDTQYCSRNGKQTYSVNITSSETATNPSISFQAPIGYDSANSRHIIYNPNFPPGTYQISYTGRSSRTDNEPTTCIQPVDKNGATIGTNDLFVRGSTAKTYSSTFVVDENFGGFITYWYHDSLTYFENVIVKCTSKAYKKVIYSNGGNKNLLDTRLINCEGKARYNAIGDKYTTTQVSGNKWTAFKVQGYDGGSNYTEFLVDRTLTTTKNTSCTFTKTSSHKYLRFGLNGDVVTDALAVMDISGLANGVYTFSARFYITNANTYSSYFDKCKLEAGSQATTYSGVGPETGIVNVDKCQYKTLPTSTRTHYRFVGWKSSIAEWNDTTIKAGASDYHIYKTLVENVKPGRSYNVSIGSAVKSAGTATKFSIIIYDYDANLDLDVETPTFGNDLNFTLTCPSTADASHNIDILIYAGLAGQTAGNTVKYSDIAVVSSDATFVSTTDILSKPDTNVLVAQWELQTRKLLINYVSNNKQTNLTNLIISATGGVISSPSVPAGGGSTITHTYSTTPITLTFSRANTSYNYFMSVGSTPTTSSKYNSITYSWTPNQADDSTPNDESSVPTTTITVYAYQRYTISFNGNGHTSGTVPSTMYKLHGSALTIPTNTLTRTGYTANGWNTKSDGTGTSHTTSYGYSTGNVTLYAQWIPNNYTVYFDENGGSAVSDKTVTYDSTYGTLPTPTRTGCTFGGWYTNEGFITQVTSSTIVKSAGNHTLYAKWIDNGANDLKYDSTEKYFYFEDGKYPQTYVGNSLNATLNSVKPPQEETIKYFDGKNNIIIPICSYNGVEYAQLTAKNTITLTLSGGDFTFTSGQTYWFKVEPIRWRVSAYGVSSTAYPSGWTSYGSSKTNFTVVSDRVLSVSAVTNLNTKEDWSFTNGNLFTNVLANSTYGLSYHVTNGSVSYDKFGSTNGNIKVTKFNMAYTGIRVASETDIMTNLSDKSAKASDMVKFLLGTSSEYVDYWTRDLITLNNGKVITKIGEPRSRWLDQIAGVRFAMTMSEGVRVSQS